MRLYFLFMLVSAFIFARGAYAQPQRPGMGTKTVFLLDGKPVSFLVSSLGGDVYADVLTQKSPDDAHPSKHIANPKLDELSFSFSAIQAGLVAEWLNETMQGKLLPKAVSLITCDANLNIIESKDYDSVVPTEFYLSNFDGTSKELGKLFLKLKASTVKSGSRSGKCPTVDFSRKLWSPSNFKFELQGLETKLVRSIDSLAVAFKYNVSQNNRDQGFSLQEIAISNFVVTFSMSDRKSWEEWFNQFVLQGRSGQQEEKQGEISLLDATMKDEIGRMRLFNVGIFRLSQVINESSTDRIQLLRAHLYAERIEINLK